MNPRARGCGGLLLLIAVCVRLILFFRPALAFVELAARSLRHLWWLVLILALAIWLIWGVNRKR